MCAKRWVLGLLMCAMVSHAGSEHWQSSDDDPFAVEHTIPLADKVNELSHEVETLQKLDLVSQVSDLEQKLKHLTGVVEEQNHLLSELKMEIHEKKVAPPKVHEAHASEQYKKALSLLKKKDYVHAKKELTSLLKRAPKGPFAARAHYWLGEIELVQGHLHQAGLAFSSVRRDDPKSARAADATLKLAYIAQEQGKKARAQYLYKQVLAHHPGSHAADLASRALHSKAHHHGSRA